PPAPAAAPPPPPPPPPPAQQWAPPPQAAAPPAAPAPAPAAAAGQLEFVISEDGRNGRAILTDRGIDRILKKTIGRDDRQFIPFTAITMVSHDRKTVGRDRVLINMAHGDSLTWKIARDAEGFVNHVNAALGGR
ncbi:MAG: hypothetical protein AAF547_22800, partial [Actinomycetota bacterium]